MIEIRLVDKSIPITNGLLSIKLSYDNTTDIDAFLESMYDSATRQALIGIADKLAVKDGGHNKFLEAINVVLCIKAPRYWWQECDTYRAGVTKSSQSTMHTLKKRPLSQDDFASPINASYLDFLNKLISSGASKVEIKNALPEGFMQMRVVALNYKVLRNMYSQRKNHELQEWKDFCAFIVENLPHSNWITG
jgi:hypothetical protein